MFTQTTYQHGKRRASDEATKDIGRGAETRLEIGRRGKYGERGRENGNWQLRVGKRGQGAVADTLQGHVHIRTATAPSLEEEAKRVVMAADNHDAYNITPGFVLETVRAAKILHREQPLAGTGTRKCYAKEGNILHAIHEFLAWPAERVKHALAQLQSIEEGDLDEEAIKSLPTPKAATVFHDEIKKEKRRGRLPSKEKQRRARRRA